MGSAPYYTNCYLFTDNAGNAVLFDCSIRWEKIDAILKNDNAQLKAVFMTHGHHDHRECMEDLRRNCDAPIYMGRQDILQFHMEDINEFKDKETFEIGEMKNIEGAYSPRVTAVKELFEASGINVRIPEDMARAKWLKFMINVSENQSSAVLGICYKAWTGISPSADFIREKIALEVIAIAQAQGINLSEEDLKQRRKRVLRVLPQNKTSTLQDIEAGRHTEVDIFAGTIMRLGERFGIPTPYNEMMYHIIKVREEKNDGMFNV